EAGPEVIHTMIQDSLEDLAEEESSIKLQKQAEEKLSETLVSMNRTLYALHAINEKRNLGICHSLESTGFEFSIRPIVKSFSDQNCTFNTKAFLRVCIKTSPFLELEDWTLCLHHDDPSPTASIMHTTAKLVPIIGFEPFYENALERFIIWERDIEIDIVNTYPLPLNVKASLIMSTRATMNGSVTEGEALDAENESVIEFPVSDTTVDDFHFLYPCHPNMAMTIERRGLDEVTHRLITSYNAQKLRKQGQKQLLSLFSYKSIHIKYNIASDFSDASYRSLLSTIFGEGHSLTTVQDILRDGAERALFFLVAYPGSPVIVKLSRESPTVLDFCLQCSYPPALFKAEATLLQRIYDRLKQSHTMTMDEQQTSKDSKHAINFLQKFKSLEESVFQLQREYYQHQRSNTSDSNGLWSRLKQTIDLLYSIQQPEPIGYIHSFDNA
ncbi:hypothetical protein BDF20DRAFT_811261, partial [Mycotypha africana]|uniref:uncharacterized protein n=1 Tax=Mycotypha africana TaxID=64632 RepID=UPI0023016645